MAGGFLAIGCFFSALTKSQVISFILAVAACGVLVYAGRSTTLDYLSAFLPVGMLKAVESMSLENALLTLFREECWNSRICHTLRCLIVGWMSGCCLVLDERKTS